MNLIPFALIALASCGLVLLADLKTPNARFWAVLALASLNACAAIYVWFEMFALRHNL